jgi:DNA-directed RNA polymerase subunit M/transcription elongation factor TFIIS
MHNRPFCSKHGRYYNYQCPECTNELDTDDLALLADKRKQKKEQKQKENINTQKWIEDALGIKNESSYEICPDCGHRSLRYLTSLTKKCYNHDCPSNFKSLGDSIRDSL